jgi:hypothetical protein
MTTREEFLRHLWTEIINPVFRDSALDNIVSNDPRTHSQAVHAEVD